ncbi:hypothetical protein C8E03_108154 [Lachnotalea glycerini]|uniref:Uncharacterized protein n=1 Tax=Lachnotalea glycerini TaxID=1763509 RepID=A0A318EK54_9FIRM|nr:hypothetical protein [Lachnotalea glycerini]PXV88427.1 hypothetical protein C8E03_108154 [Lachnotalea glycerini]
MAKKLKEITLNNIKIALLQLFCKKNRAKIKYLPLILVIIIALIFPIMLEFLVIYNNIPSSFNNSEWFVFWSGYIGSIITILTFYITIRLESKKSRLQLSKQYENSRIEKEIERATKVKNIILLDKYRFNFSNKNDMVDEYKSFSRDFLDIESDLKKMAWINEATSHKNEFFKRLNLIAKYERFTLLERLANTNEEFIDGVLKDIKELSRLSNNNRNELNDLYDNYIDEMMKKIYDI